MLKVEEAWMGNTWRASNPLLAPSFLFSSFFSAQDSTEFSIGGEGEPFPPLSFPGVVLGSEEFARGSLGEIPFLGGGKREMSEN